MIDVAPPIESRPIFTERLRRERAELLVSRLRWALEIGIVVYLAFVALDYAVSPEHGNLFLLIRIAAVINSVAAFLLLRTEFGQRHALSLSLWAMFVYEFGVVIMTVFLGGFIHVYYIGIILVIFGAGIFLPWKPLPTALSGGLCLLAYFAANYLFVGTANLTWPTVLTPVFFMLFSVVITVTSNIGQERSRQRDLAQRLQIEQANEDLKELDKTKTRFFSNVSHELRTPLTLILGPLEALLQGQAPANPRPLLEAMDSNARRLLRQVNALLDFAKLDAGKLECKFAYGNIGRLLEELFRATRPHADRRRIDLTISGTESLPDSILDAAKVETIAANLISNAVKFTPAGGKIVIRAGFDDDHIWFEVEDTGPGIPEDQIGLLFERFRQLDDALSRRAEGTGLGLSLVKELTLMHGGRVIPRSKVGVGTTFRVELPRRPEVRPVDRRRIIGRRKIDQFSQERTISQLVAAHEDGRSHAKTLLADVATSKLGGGILIDQEIKQAASPDAQKVLVVDDNPDIRTFIASNLAGDYRVAVAGDGDEALEVARRFQPHLIISDIMMPHMDGYEFCRQVRADKTLGQVPIILATSKGGGEAVVEGLATGANDYLAKPFEIRELKARVAAHLRASRLENSLSERDSRLAAIGQMTSSIVHDLKNPLNAIVGFAQIASQDAATLGNPDLLEDLEPIVSEAGRLGRMIAEVLEFARGCAGDVRLEPTDLTPFLAAAVAPWKSKLEPMGVSLAIDLQLPERLQIDLDPDHTIRIVENLLKNAQEALCGEGRDPQGKHVWVSARVDGAGVAMRVADDGPGLSDEIAARLFEPFATSGKRSGTGLGLVTVRNLVKAQGGEIAVTPKAPEGGAAFTVTFPIRKG